jgi:hypothetical protein
MTGPRPGLAAALLALCLAVTPASAAEPVKNVVVSKDKPLSEAVFFCFDKAAFPTQENVKLELIEGKYPKKIVWPEPDPQGSPAQPMVVRVGDEFRAWYIGNAVWKPTFHLCYAVSKDGVGWEKPVLNLVDFKGDSKKNNILPWPFKQSWTIHVILHDPEEPDRAKRFKLAAQLYDPEKGAARGLGIAFSPDGIHWKAAGKPTTPTFFEMGGVAKFKGRYVMVGQASPPRRLNVLTSDDFVKWKDHGVSFKRDHLKLIDDVTVPEFPDAEKWPVLANSEGEPIHVGASLWSRGNVLIGIYGQWHGRPKDRRRTTIDGGLVISRDGVKFTEPVESFKLVDASKCPGPPKGKNAPSIVQGGIENFGDKTLFWHAGWAGMQMPAKYPFAIVTWERDRLGMLRPTGKAAKVVSEPVQITKGGAGVYVNASGLDKDNRLRISLLDEKSQGVAGFSGADAATIDKNGLRVPVTWKGGKAISADLRKVQIQVAFEGGRGRLHAVYVGGRSRR